MLHWKLIGPPEVNSPKSCTTPVDAIVTNSISVHVVGLYPPPNTPLVGLERPAGTPLATLKLPKSIAFPVDAIVTYSISVILALLGFFPPPNIPLVALAHPPHICSCLSPNYQNFL